MMNQRDKNMRPMSRKNSKNYQQFSRRENQLHLLSNHNKWVMYVFANAKCARFFQAS